MNNPIQPIVKDINGVLRFKPNAIVEYLLDSHTTCDLNTIASLPFTREDRQQLAQLIGYSLSGYAELRVVDDDNYNAAVAMSEGLTEDQARIQTLQQEVDYLRSVLREPMARLFGVHPDDLSRNINE